MVKNHNRAGKPSEDVRNLAASGASSIIVLSSQSADDRPAIAKINAAGLHSAIGIYLVNVSAGSSGFKLSSGVGGVRMLRAQQQQAAARVQRVDLDDFWNMTPTVHLEKIGVTGINHGYFRDIRQEYKDEMVIIATMYARHASDDEMEAFKSKMKADYSARFAEHIRRETARDTRSTKESLRSLGQKSLSKEEEEGEQAAIMTTIGDILKKSGTWSELDTSDAEEFSAILARKAQLDWSTFLAVRGTAVLIGRTPPLSAAPRSGVSLPVIPRSAQAGDRATSRLVAGSILAPQTGPTSAAAWSDSIAVWLKR